MEVGLIVPWHAGIEHLVHRGFCHRRRNRFCLLDSASPRRWLSLVAIEPLAWALSKSNPSNVVPKTPRFLTLPGPSQRFSSADARHSFISQQRDTDLHLWAICAYLCRPIRAVLADFSLTSHVCLSSRFVKLVPKLTCLRPFAA
jgi:hypothetical protein